MGKWYSEYEKAYGSGAPEWFFILYEGASAPKIQVQRYSKKGSEWITVHEGSLKFASAEEEAQALALLNEILKGFVPEKKKVIPFGKL